MKYELIWEEDKPFSKCENIITSNTELVSAYQVLNLDKKLNETSYYQHFIEMSTRLGIPDVQEYLDYMLITDYIIGNADRHYNNFGFIRNVQSLRYEGIAPVYDSGNSMWFDTSTARIDFEKDIPSMPFKKFHSEQIQLVHSFEEIDLNTLQGIEEEFKTLLISSPDIDQPRTIKLCEGLKYRTHYLEEIKEKSVKKSLYVTNDEAIKKDIKKTGYKVTATLVNNIRKLNELQGKDMTLEKIKEFYTNADNIPGKEKYLIKAIGDECTLQLTNLEVNAP
ncbi:MAG: HipA domain-containing protein [Anaerocolumna sp.]